MGKKVLVIDDEPDTLTFMETVLIDNGYEAITCASAIEAVDIARTEIPDLILLDLIMPEKSGIKLFGELKTDEQLSKIPVVVVSGVSQITGADFRDFSLKMPSFSQGTDGITYVRPEGFVEKPVDPEELIRVIKEVLND